MNLQLQLESVLLAICVTNGVNVLGGHYVENLDPDIRDLRHTFRGAQQHQSNNTKCDGFANHTFFLEAPCIIFISNDIY